VVFGTAIGIAERGRLIANWYGKAELSMCDGAVWNMAQMRLATGRRQGVGVIEVEAPAGDGQGIVTVAGGFVVKLVSIRGHLEPVDIDGTGGAPGWGISFSGYEERS